MPVDVVSGSQYTAAHDLTMGGYMPLLFRRSYNTDWLSRPASALGRGWSHAFESRLLRDLDGYRFIGHDGSEVLFDGDENELLAGVTLRSLPDFMELRQEGSHLVVWHWHGWRGPVRRFVFDPRSGDEMQAVALENPAGHALKLAYDDRGRLKRVEQSIERRALLLEYGRDGMLAELRLAWAAEPGREPLPIASYSYDQWQRLTEVHNARGTTGYEYDEQHRLTTERGPSGSVALMRYDAEGRCVAMGGADGFMSRTFHYDELARRTVVTDSLGSQTTYQYNEKGQIILVLQPNGAETTTQFDEMGRIVSVAGPLCEDGPSIARKYDDAGDLVEVQYANRATRKLEYDGSHQVTAIHDITGLVWRIRYERGAIAEVLNPRGEATQYRHDDRNVLSEIVTAWGNRIRIEHDELWRYERHVDLVGTLFAHEYNIFLLPVTVADSTGITGWFEYDSLGALTRHRSPDGAQSLYSYTPTGMLQEYVNANGGRTGIEWSPWNLCLRVSDANRLTHEFEWDTEGRLTAVRNPRGERTELTYNAVGRNVATRFFDGSLETYEHDQNGNLIARTRPDGSRIDIDVDEMGKEAAVKLNGVPTLTFAYDAAGRELKAVSPDAAVEFTYDECGRIASETQRGRAVRYVYGPHGNTVKREFDGSIVGPLYFEYDIRARLIGIRDSRGALQQFVYDARDLVTERVMAGVRERLEYDYGGRPLRQEIAGGELSAPILRTYRYDPEGNLLAVSDSRFGAATFAYDPGERLQASENFGAKTEYAYDATGNLTDRGDVRLRYGAGDRLLGIGAIDIERDANGNLLHTVADRKRWCHQWNALGQLVAVQHPDGALTRYGYDAFGRRVCKERNLETTEFFWSGNDLLAESQGASLTEYAVDQFWPHLIWNDGEARHAIVSPLGLIHELIDAKGALAWSGWYDPWGALVQSRGPGPEPRIRYPGQYFDSETGFHYNRARYYDPRAGSFISPDPIGLNGGTNLYLYGPNPVTYEDPWGLQCGANTSGYSVYVLTNGNPPQVVYVGITDQLPHQRLSGHRGDKPPGSFDNMQVIATGLQSRRSARNIEGSLLNRIFAAQQAGTTYNVAGIPVAPSLLNGRRTATPGYQHGYVRGSPSIGQDGRRILTPSELGNRTGIIGAPIPR